MLLRSNVVVNRRWVVIDQRVGETLVDWQPFIKASWELVVQAEGRTEVVLEDDLEAYLVHLMARNFRNTRLPPEIICLEFPQAKTPEDFRQIGDSCLFIDAWDVRRARLVSRDYYERMGQLAYGSAALASRPREPFFERVAREFSVLSRVLRGVYRLGYDRGVCNATSFS